MNKVLLYLTSLTITFGLSTAAMAQGVSFELSGTAGVVSNQDGGSSIESNGGIDGESTRGTGSLSISTAYNFSNTITGVAALGFSAFADADDDLDVDDTTMETLDLTLRVLSTSGNLTYGGFIGAGSHNDNGDSDEDMTYEFIGAEVEVAASFGSYFAQVGYLDSADEYDEGTQDAPFINAGLNYRMFDDYNFVGTFGFAGGNKYGDEDSGNRVLSASVGIERMVGNLLVSAGYEITEISYKYDGDDTRYGDTFGTLSIGATFAFGGQANHGTPLPNFGNWVAFNANEVE